MDLERNFILLNVINKLEKIQSDSNTSSCIYAAFINDACNYLVSYDCNTIK